MNSQKGNESLGKIVTGDDVIRNHKYLKLHGHRHGTKHWALHMCICMGMMYGLSFGHGDGNEERHRWARAEASA
jgi:hypothetical protein